MNRGERFDIQTVALGPSFIVDDHLDIACGEG